jgi:hypothetical protein
MRDELIDIVCKLKEIREAQDVYFQTIPTDLRACIFDNKYIDLLETKVQILTDIAFKGSQEDIYWFLYEFKAGQTDGPHIIDQTGKKWTFKTNKDYYRYLENLE